MEQEHLWRTRILLETLLDYLPRAGRSSVTSLSGPAPSRYVPCPTCHGKRHLFSSTRGRFLCPNCEGHGVRRRRASEPYYDEYTGEQVTAEGEKPLRTMTAAELTAALARIERDQAEREGRIAPNDELPWVRKREAMWRLGDYESALTALNVIAAKHPREANAVLHRLVYGSDLPIRQASELVDRGVKLVAGHMPPVVRVPPWYLPDPAAVKTSQWRGRTSRHEMARGQRNELIRVMVSEGHSVTAVAREFHLTRRHVQRVVREAA